MVNKLEDIFKMNVLCKKKDYTMACLDVLHCFVMGSF